MHGAHTASSTAERGAAVSCSQVELYLRWGRAIAVRAADLGVRGAAQPFEPHVHRADHLPGRGEASDPGEKSKPR